MKLLVLYWSFLLIGYVIAWQMRKQGRLFPWVNFATLSTICILCFVMGLRMGVNDQVTSNLGTIGLMSLIITVFCVAGSMGAIFIFRKIFHMDKCGNVIERDSVNNEQDEEREKFDISLSAEGESNLNIKSTFIILGFVSAGMIIGALVIAKVSFLMEFNSVSYYCLIIILCVLLLFVGYELGASGTLFSSIKTVGFKIFAFPFAAVLGTLIIGTAVCMLMGFSLKEGLAICLGFGWYSYAPVVIAAAGKQYMIASAVSFMHNIIRETAGIILIPIIAKKIGYLESAGVPGVAAMDVCIPIVERSCRPDTVLYSFVIGLLMCIVTSFGVPLVMGL